MKLRDLFTNSRAGRLIQKIYGDAGGRLDEGKRYDLGGREAVRVDNPTHGVGQVHAHTRDGVVNKDGTSSHGTGPFQLTKREFEFLKGRGFELKGRLVEDLEPAARHQLESFRRKL